MQWNAELFGFWVSGFPHDRRAVAIDLMPSQSCGGPKRIPGSSKTKFFSGLQL